MFNTCGEELFLGVSHVATARGRSQRSSILEFLSIYAYTHCRRTVEFDMVTHMGEGRVFWGQPRLPSQESGVQGLRNFEGSPVLHTPFNPRTTKFRHGNVHGRGVL